MTDKTRKFKWKMLLTLRSHKKYSSFFSGVVNTFVVSLNVIFSTFLARSVTFLASIPLPSKGNLFPCSIHLGPGGFLYVALFWHSWFFLFLVYLRSQCSNLACDGDEHRMQAWMASPLVTFNLRSQGWDKIPSFVRRKRFVCFLNKVF